MLSMINFGCSDCNRVMIWSRHRPQAFDVEAEISGRRRVGPVQPLGAADDSGRAARSPPLRRFD
jgi:hypothetical protein